MEVCSKMALFQKKDHRELLVEKLKEDYLNEIQISKQMKLHAESARYNHYRDQLLYLSELEKKQAGIIKELLEKLDSKVPEKIPSVKPVTDRNLFEALNRDLEMDHEDYIHYYDRIRQAEEGGFTDLLPTLNKLREDESEHRKTILSILQRLNPYQV
jgi:rubrerythrin